MNESETVVLIHGLAANRLIMSLLALRLEKRGYRTVNWGYPSLLNPIEKIAQRFNRQLEKLTHDESTKRVHVVAHSMGSIISRFALEKQPPGKLGRMVMLGPPNCGSPVATRVAGLLGFLLPGVVQLTDKKDSFVNQLPPEPPCETGVIAATRDRVVPIGSTSFSSCPWISFNSGHSELLFRRDVCDEIVHFLQHGEFKNPSPSKGVKTAQ